MAKNRMPGIPEVGKRQKTLGGTKLGLNFISCNAGFQTITLHIHLQIKQNWCQIEDNFKDNT